MNSSTLFNFSRIALIVLLSILSISNGYAKKFETVEIVHFDTLEPINVAQQSLLLTDPENKYTIDDILFPNNITRDLFVPIEKDIENLGFTTSAYWVVFKVKNSTNVDHEALLEIARPLTNRATLYIRNEQGAITKMESGDDLEFSMRPYADEKIIFPLELLANESYEFYVYLKSDGEVINLPVLLWSKDDYISFSGRENLFLGIFYGILIFVSIIYFFFFVALKHRAFLFYSLYVVSLIFMQFSLDGFSFHFLWPKWPWWANHAVPFIPAVSVLLVMRYAQEFLDLKYYFKALNTAFNIMQILCVISMGFALTNGFLYEINYPFVNAIGSISILLILFSLLIYKIKSIKVDGFFQVAFIFLATGALIWLLGNFNVIENTVLIQNAIKIGSGMEVIFLSLSMASRYRNTQREKEEAQRKTVEQLEELNRLKEEQNIKLEQQVKERTQVIALKSKELEEKNKNITASILYAQRIQNAILPSDETVNMLLSKSFIFYQPKDIVSGDFYWVNQLDESTFFAVADCTGHGVPGAFMSIVGQNGLNKAVNEYRIKSSRMILDQLNVEVSQALRQKEKEIAIKDGMDIALCCLNSKNGIIQYSGGNNPLYLIRKSNTELTLDNISGASRMYSNPPYYLFEFKADKHPIGAYLEESLVPFSQHKIALKKGDRVYLFSDGFADQFGGPDGKKYKYKPFKQFLLDIQQHQMRKQRLLIQKEFDDWRGDEEQIDDVCIMGVEYDG